jgi:hypothetical protein
MLQYLIFKRKRNFVDENEISLDTKNFLISNFRRVVNVVCYFLLGNFEPTFSCIYISTILKPSYYFSSYPPAHEDGTDRVFRNVGIQKFRRRGITQKKITYY